MPARVEGYRSHRLLGQIALAALVTCVIGLPSLLLPAPFSAIVPIVLALSPLVIVLAFRIPFALCLVFIVFSFFRIHEAFPVLNPLRIPSLVAIATLSVLAWQILLSKQIKPYWSRELNVCMIFVAIVTAGVPFAVSRPTAMAYWTATYWKIAVITVAIAWLVRTPRDFGIAARSLILGSLLISSVAISNKLAGIGLVEGTRVTIARDIGSVLGDPNDLSLILLFPLGFAAAMTVLPTGRWNRLYGAISCAVIIWAIICTQSRGGLLGILSVCGIIGLRVVRSKALLVTVGLLAGLVLFAAMGINKRASGGAHEDGIDESAMGRIYAWGAAWKMATSRPLTGVGLDNFVANYFFYSDHWDGMNHAVHSTWFNVLSETGFPGFFCFLYMIGVIFHSAYNSMHQLSQARAPPIMQSTALALVAGIVGFCVGGTFLTQGFTWPIYILVSLTAATARFNHEFHTNSTQVHTQSKGSF